MSQEEQNKRMLKLKKLIADSGGTTAEFCRSYGVDPSYISQLLNGHRSFGEKAARNLEEKAGLSPGYFDEGLFLSVREPGGKYESPAVVPMKTISLRASNDSAVGFEVQYENDDTEKPIFYRREWLQKMGYRLEKLSVREIHGSSMEPALFEGDKVLINGDSRTPKNGAAFAVVIDGQLAIKRLRRRGQEWWITSDNPAHSNTDLPTGS